MTWKERMKDVGLTVLAVVQCTEEAYETQGERFDSAVDNAFLSGVEAASKTKAVRTVKKQAVVVKEKTVAAKDSVCDGVSSRWTSVREQVAARKEMLRR